ncbi:MAG: hypothetical protein US96_C0035G0016 [Candidatus Woesebacteria bacterium GW2011_GWB1_38_5b]|uniref:Membrane-bound metal-dependent hydrolase n=1 Tax=Candidatus Woesebacteria bacterium GW2011_GWB1_38_5b TaxID=1618569 RepID=A0A0G0K664_9BACT|nr:MAG: hypothetical protein US96_C0035G0016 [Candidatus Woesebacteria bacterium GW2011_GWB1_38_5b]
MHELATHELLHGVIAIPFVLIVWRNTKSLIKILLLFVVAYSIDLDHLLDYFLYAGSNFDLGFFLSSEYFAASHHAYVIFHGWEWLLILGLLSYRERWRGFFTVLFFGLASHLVLDAINVGNFAFYSFLYRLIRGFIFYS